MKKFNFTLLVCLLLAGIFASCDDDDKYPVPPEVSIEECKRSVRNASGRLYRTESESRKSAANHTELVRQRK